MGSLCFLAEKLEPSRPQTCGFSPSLRPVTKASTGNTDRNSCWLCNERESLLPGTDLGVGPWFLVKVSGLPWTQRVVTRTFLHCSVSRCVVCKSLISKEKASGFRISGCDFHSQCGLGQDAKPLEASVSSSSKIAGALNRV